MSRRRTRPRERSGLKDHAWGAALGVVFVIFLGVFFLGGQITGAGAATCDKPLAPMPGGNDVSAAAFASEDAALGRVIDYLYTGDRESADVEFLGPVHSFTHNVDPAVRAADPDVARKLCNAVIQLENGLAGSSTATPELAQSTIAVREALRDSAVALGYPRPAEEAQ